MSSGPGAPAWIGTSSRAASRQRTSAQAARFATSPDTVVTPSRSHRGWRSRYASASESSMFVPTSVSRTRGIVCNGCSGFGAVYTYAGDGLAPHQADAVAVPKHFQVLHAPVLPPRGGVADFDFAVG